MTTNTPCSCGNCEWKGRIDDTHLSNHLRERLVDGCGGITIVPVGDCPECGAFCYRDQDSTTFARIRDADAILNTIASMTKDGERLNDAGEIVEDDSAEMTIDNAYETAAACIDLARAILEKHADPARALALDGIDHDAAARTLLGD